MNFKTSLKNQKVTLVDALLPEEERFERMEPIRDQNVLATIAIIGLGIVVGMTISATIRKCETNHEPIAVKNNCTNCHNRQTHMGWYFKKNKVKSPEMMAEAVLKTRNPRLLAALNVGGEKKTPHTARNTGYKNKYSGPWQTSENWGKITKNTTVTQMALIAELALETHVAEEKNIIRGLNAHGGESDKDNGQFAYNVLKELQTGGIP